MRITIRYSLVFYHLRSTQVQFSYTKCTCITLQNVKQNMPIPHNFTSEDEQNDIGGKDITHLPLTGKKATDCSKIHTTEQN